MTLALRLADEIAKTLQRNGPLWSLREEWCSQTFQQAHAIRAMLGAHRLRPRGAYLEAACDWADMTLRLQGTHGHPDRYNMGYGFRIRKGVPQNWFVADCGTVAVALLDVAALLGASDPLRQRILDSVCRFADDVAREWTLSDGSITLGYMDFERLNKKAYHCANAQSNLFLWPLAAMTGQDVYRRRALAATRWMAGWRGYDEGYYGSPIHDRAYNGESLCVSLAWLPASEASLRRRIMANLSRHIVDWAVRGHGSLWHKGGKPSHAKDPLLLLVLRLYQQRVRDSAPVSAVVRKAYSEEARNVAQAFSRLAKSGASGEAIAIHTKPGWLLQNVTLPKFYTTDGITGMALVVSEDPAALFPLGGAAVAAGRPS